MSAENDPEPRLRLLEAARALGPRIRAAADEGERERKLPREMFQALAESRLLRMYVPRALGGLEVDPLTFLSVVEEVARHDGATGWNLAIWAAYGVYAGYLRQDVAEEMFGRGPSVVLAGTFNPTGKALAVDGGYQVSGRWGFGSGIQHST